MQNERYASLAKTRQARITQARGFGAPVSFDEYTTIQNRPNKTHYDLEITSRSVASLLTQEKITIETSKTDSDILSWIVNSLSASPMGVNLLQEAVRLNWRVQLESLENGGFNLDYDQKTIAIDNYGFDAKTLSHAPHYYLSMVPILAKALRDMCHEVAIHTRNYKLKPEAYLQLERIRAADIDTIAVFVGWELRTAGHDDIWRNVLAGQDGDMAQTMMNIIGRYPTANHDGMALAHVFRQWFVDEERVDTVDFYTLEHIDTLVADNNQLLGDENLTPKHLNMIAFMFDGKTYLKDLELVIIKDPYFTSVNDPINQTHLFQIVYDSKVTIVKDIPFRDESLAKKFH